MIDETQLALLLNMPPPELHQDWGIEFASSERAENFIESLASLDLTSRAEFILLELIVASIDERIETGGTNLSDEALALVVDRLENYALLQEYWLSDKHASEFPVVQLLRDFQRRKN